MAFIISKDRYNFIQDSLLFRRGVEYPYNQPNAIYGALENTQEIHYYVSNFNWDGQTDVLNLVINDKRCDKATASMIFWRGAPRFYTRYATRAEADVDYAGVLYSLLKEIVSNWESGFYTSQRIAYNPNVDSRFEVNGIEPNEKWSIPDSLKVALPGEVVTVEA